MNKWHSTPRKLLSSHCPCSDDPPNLPSTGPTGAVFVSDQLDRFAHAWKRTAFLDLPPGVRDAAQRVVLQLRAQGIEKVHITGIESPPVHAHLFGAAAGADGIDLTGKREIRMVFLIPDPSNEQTGHRWVAELLVFLQPDSKHKVQVRRVLSRHATDWEDWTMFVPQDYAEAEGDSKVHITAPNAMINHDMVIDQLLFEIQKLRIKNIGFTSESAQRLSATIITAMDEVRASGMDVFGFGMNKVFRRVGAGQGMYGKGEYYIPTIRIGLKVVTGTSRRKETPAVVLIERGIAGMSGEEATPHIRVVYNWEWQIEHVYSGAVPVVTL
nr:uncharacterized protein CI109_005712 [Kwoniella shandongensis]KAA5525965.1 hypothetical protein CI109_005712 [Kwoniella shandongensis]